MKTVSPPSEMMERAHQSGDVHLIREVVRTHQTLLAVFSREVGMPASRLAVMRLLALAEPRTIGVMEMSRQLDVNAAAITRQVQDMEKDRLIVRRSDPRDKRRSHIALSAKGRRLFEELHQRSHNLERSLASEIDPRELKIAAKVLGALREALDRLR